MMRGMRHAALLLAPLALTAAVAGAAPPPGPLIVARLGQTVRIGGERVTPLRVIEDSRCPVGVACIRAGRVRIAARVGRATRELTLGQPTQVAGGALQLVQVRPPRRRDMAIPARAYRFGFRFDDAARLRLIRR
jgi:hypothetical protein